MFVDIYVWLEDYGIVVWELIDGKRIVCWIIEELVEYFNYEENYELCIMVYII